MEAGLPTGRARGRRKLMEPQEVVTVVVIDDDDDVREGVSTLLALSDDAVHTAADGLSGLALTSLMSSPVSAA